MAILPYLPEHVEHFDGRLNELTADSERQFGKLDSTNMLRHMRKSFETAVGDDDEDVKDISTPVLRTVVFFIVTRLIKKWPGGKFKAPRYWSPSAEHEFDEELKLFHEATRKFLDKLASEPNERHVHPVFGKLSVRQWGLLLGPHLNHHLRQFSV